LTVLLVLFGVLEASGEEVLRLTPSMAKTVSVPDAIKGHFTGFVANPDIADVYLGQNSMFVFVGKKAGRTNFIATDNNSGVVLYRVTLDVSGNIVTIYHTLAKGLQYICDRSTCNPLEGAGGSAAPTLPPAGATSPPP
jgi:Flp pilus assembly secretin CpaC